MNQASYPTLGLYNCEWASYLARIKSKLQYMQGNSIISILNLGALEYNAIDLILFFFPDTNHCSKKVNCACLLYIEHGVMQSGYNYKVREIQDCLFSTRYYQ